MAMIHGNDEIRQKPLFKDDNAPVRDDTNLFFLRCGFFDDGEGLA
jgi:hypothetical protein